MIAVNKTQHLDRLSFKCTYYSRDTRDFCGLYVPIKLKTKSCIFKVKYL